MARKYSLKHIVMSSVLAGLVCFSVGRHNGYIDGCRVFVQPQPEVHKIVQESEVAGFGLSDLEKILGRPVASCTESACTAFAATPGAERFSLMIADEINDLYCDEYRRLLEASGGVEFAEMIVGDYNRFYLRNYAELSNAPKSLELMQALGTDFISSRTDDYTFLLKKGVGVDIIAEANKENIHTLVIEMRKGDFPEELIPYFTLNPIQYSIKAALQVAFRSGPDLGSHEDKVREHLIKRLSSREHCYRLNTDYKENFEQIENINNLNILYLIKGYVDYFDDADNLKKIFSMVDNDYFPMIYSEDGGLVLSRKEGYEFFRYNIRESSVDKNIMNDRTFDHPVWFKYVGVVGTFHFHASSTSGPGCCGPSGSAVEPKSADMGSLAGRLVRNVYTMDCVVTRMDDGRINADIYFRDVDLNNYSWDFKAKPIMVLDLGLFGRP